MTIKEETKKLKRKCGRFYHSREDKKYYIGQVQKHLESKDFNVPIESSMRTNWFSKGYFPNNLFLLRELDEFNQTYTGQENGPTEEKTIDNAMGLEASNQH